MGLPSNTLIYLAKSPSGKMYIGLTSRTLKRRVQDHYSSARTGSHYTFHKALRKYDKKVKFRVLNSGLTLDEAKDLEVGYIALFNTLRKGYNDSSGGESRYGIKHSDETKRRISENSTQKKKVICNETRKVFESAAECYKGIGVSKIYFINHINRREKIRKYKLKNGEVATCIKRWPHVKGKTYSYLEDKCRYQD